MWPVGMMLVPPPWSSMVYNHFIRQIFIGKSGEGAEMLIPLSLSYLSLLTWCCIAYICLWFNGEFIWSELHST